jgi:hypothetical protein
MKHVNCKGEFKMIEKEKLVTLNDDEKAVVLKRLSEIYNTTGEMFNELKRNELTEEMRDTLFSLIESYTAEASKILKYDSQASAKIAARYADIRKANQKIHDLEKMLAENTDVSGLKELLYAMHRALNDWWRKLGFNLVTDDEFGGYGFKGRFCLDTSHISFVSTRPVTEKKERKNRLEQMIEDGYEFAQEDRREYVLLDTPKNRELITKLVKDKFPSLDISKWENWCLRKGDGFQLRSFEAYIRSFEELKALTDEMKEDPEDEEEE